MSFLTAIIDAIPATLPDERRYVIAVAGPPASGKSTLARELCDHLGERSAVFGMDAYHYDDAVLEARGLLARKGSIDTFDPGAYRRGLTALRDDPTESISIPVFDRELELSRNCAEIITPAQQVIITEGNYLLVQREPWNALDELFDLTVWVSAPVEVLRERLMDRWRSHGYDEATASHKTEQNDLPNAAFIVAESGQAQIELVSEN